MNVFPILILEGRMLKKRAVSDRFEANMRTILIFVKREFFQFLAGDTTRIAPVNPLVSIDNSVRWKIALASPPPARTE